MHSKPKSMKYPAKPNPQTQSQRSAFESQGLPALLFYEALCGWEEPKNNLHNTAGMKLIPKPHLLLWLRLLICRLMTTRVCLLQALGTVYVSCQEWETCQKCRGWEGREVTRGKFPHPASALHRGTSARPFVKYDTGPSFTETQKGHLFQLKQ